MSILVGLSPSISVVNGTDMIKVTTGTKVLLYFEVISYPPLISDPQLTFNNSGLPYGWYIIPPNTSVLSLSHFSIGIAIDHFLPKDNGDYSITVNNTCSSLTKTMTITGK